MQAQLALVMFALASLVCGGLAFRELLRAGPYQVPAWGCLACLAIALWSRFRGPTRVLTLLFLGLLVTLVTAAALRAGGAAASSLCFSFIPGFVAVLLVGPALGWLVCGLMLACMAGLYLVMPPLQQYDLLRFIDELGMTVWTTGLAHALHASFGRYESAISRNRRALFAFRDRRLAMATAIYEELEPQSSELEASSGAEGARSFDATRCLACLSRMSEQLAHAKVLAQQEHTQPVRLEQSDRTIRRHAMRRWLQLGAVFMAFIVVRNFVLGVSYQPSLFSLAFCLGFDWWLARNASLAYLEQAALAIGLAASGPLIVHIHNYGARPDAPALVVTPATVLFTALLSQGPAAWAILALNCGILAWVGRGSLTAFESRLLSDQVAAFLAITLCMRSVFKLRSDYARTLLEQTENVAQALRQHRRLAGTLFHDVSNQLQTMVFYLDTDEAIDVAALRSLARRVGGLIRLSKEFLVGHGQDQPAVLERCRLRDAMLALTEAFGPRLRAKSTRFEAEQGLDLSVLAQPELLVESVLGNLLSNAIKFAPPGSRVALRAEQIGAEVRVSLLDQGPGLSAAVAGAVGGDAPLPSLPGTAGEKGQGYGLQLVREHVARMGGRLELKNRAEGGTEATVWLPLAS